jgi:hypothetical protein
MVLVTVLVETVRRYVHDRVILGAIAADLQALGIATLSDPDNSQCDPDARGPTAL